MNRRSFLYQSAATLAAVGAAPAAVSAVSATSSEKKHLVGLQSYTVRKALDKDLAGTMKAIAKMGYGQIEGYGFPGKKDIVTAARDSGLAVNSSHIQWESITDPERKGKNAPSLEKIIEQAKDLKLTELVIPYLHNHQRENLDGYKKVAETIFDFTKD